MHGIIFPFTDWEREVWAVALSGVLCAHTFGKYNLTHFIRKQSHQAGEDDTGQWPVTWQWPSELCKIPELCHCGITVLPS